MNGLLINNDANNVLISSDVTPLTYDKKILHDFTANGNLKVPVSNTDGSISVWNRAGTDSSIIYIGMYHDFYGSPTYMGKRRFSNGSDLQVTEYKFRPSPPASSGYGLQLFDADGNETYNSEKPLLNIIDKVNIRVADGYNKEIKYDQYEGYYWVDRSTWSKNYPGVTKLGIMFNNVPAGISKTSSLYQIWAYFYFFRTVGSRVELEYRPEYWSSSQSSAVIELDLELELEFFVIDLSNI